MEKDGFIHLHQNPANLAPAHIIEVQRVLNIRHFGFDEEIYEGVIIVHEEVFDDVSDFFALAYEIQFPIKRIVPISDEKYLWNDEHSMSDNNTSGFNYRTIMGTEKLSNHATGRAFDVNPRQNVYIRHDKEKDETICLPDGALYDEQQKGTLTKDHPLVIFLKERGWTWGGDWKLEDGVVDYQHFEKM